jgi:hypothetical protein
VPAVKAAKRSKFPRRRDAGPSEWAVIVDTETTTDQAQRLRFGSYQVRRSDDLYERGLFFDPDVLGSAEQQTLRRYASAHQLTVRTRAEFVDQIFFGIGYDYRANIIGLNLPFDISRIAISYASARNRHGSGMSSAFSFQLSESRWRSRVVIKHLSSSLSFIQFAGDPTYYTAKSLKRRGESRIRRGYFLDLRTTARALTSELHSLESLTKELDVQHKKRKSFEHGHALTSTYIAYAVQDVEATWECFVALRKLYQAHRLRRTPLNSIYSEASLGKAYLQEMGITPMAGDAARLSSGAGGQHHERILRWSR